MRLRPILSGIILLLRRSWAAAPNLSCRDSDYRSVIGNKDITVDSIVAEIADLQWTIGVAGKMTPSVGASRAYAYEFEEASNCRINWTVEFVGVDLGIQALTWNAA